MKCLYLVCNAHIDPVWMWDWPEGAASAISTFYAAVELSAEFDYVFCHNEAMLYEYIEEYDPALFARIGELIRSGKWRVMGGWYLQPDCITPSGESIFRQIYLGKKYFSRKFGVSSQTAMNVDSFGHSRGLVQILKKSGYNSYIFCRPYPNEMDIGANPFRWSGYDSSEVIAFRAEGDGTYSSPLGRARENIEKKLELFSGQDYAMIFWGVGNHGGGPSRKDLRDIADMMAHSPFPIVHSYPEAYFSVATAEERIAGPLREGCFIKTYSSAHRIKQKHAELENALFMTEKIASAAAYIKNYPYPAKRLDEAMRAMAFCEFHDVLSGTCASDGEKSTLEYADYGLQIVHKIRTEAFFLLCEDFERAEEGEYPVFIFNPNAYETEEVVEAEFLIPDAIVSDEVCYKVEAYREGARIPVQVIKELSNINYDRRKRVALRVLLKPMEITRVDLKVSVAKKSAAASRAGDIRFKDDFKEIEIDRASGLIRSYKAGGKELSRGKLFVPYLFDDIADPWGLGLSEVGSNMRGFSLSDGSEDIFRGLEGCRITEEGDVLTQIESNFVCEGVSLRLTYKLYRQMPYIDVLCDIFYSDRLKGVRLGFGVSGKAEAAAMFGREEIRRDGKENPVQRFLRFENGLCILNKDTFSCMADDRQVFLTLLNGSCYCAHKIDERPLIDPLRFIPSIESGIHHFEYRLGCLPYGEEESAAIRFNQPYFALNHFPHGRGRKIYDGLFRSDRRISVSAVRKCGEGYELRLFNNSEDEVAAQFCLFGVYIGLCFEKFEVKTLYYKDGSLEECPLAVDEERS